MRETVVAVASMVAQVVTSQVTIGQIKVSLALEREGGWKYLEGGAVALPKTR
jgi:hypothetical protein